MKVANLMLSSTIAVISGFTHAETNSFEYVDISRYVGMKVDQHQQQADPLQTVLNITIPFEIKSIGQALNYILIDSGYSLADPLELTDEARTLINLPLPDIHRKFEYQTLNNILRVLAGEPYELLVDPIKREVNFFSIIK